MNKKRIDNESERESLRWGHMRGQWSEDGGQSKWSQGIETSREGEVGAVQGFTGGRKPKG